MHTDRHAYMSNLTAVSSTIDPSFSHTHTRTHTHSEKGKMSRQSFKVCFCFWRYFGLSKVEPPEDVKELFNTYSENGTMSVDNLLRCLRDFQGDVKATKEDAQAIVDSLKHLVFNRKGLHLEAFFRYLLSDYNIPLVSSHGEVHHNMKAPLAHYFIYTGHNSYLTGNQLSSDCSVDPIIKSLRNGVRVVELDLWPDSTKDGIEVCHGGTLTTPVELILCLEAIRENAFLASEYPVVITFEDHLNRDLRKKVAQMVMKTFGDMLFHPDVDFEELPSPESLKRNIIISTKPPKEYLEYEGSENREHWRKAKEGLVDEEHRATSKDGSNEGEDQHDEDVQDEVPEYKRLIAIHAVKLKGNIENWLYIDSNKVKRLSLSEQELEDAAKHHGSQIVRFTQRNLLRVYPRGTRFDSSNYNPFVGWMHGAQMVAFNMQGYGKNLWRMQGMFRANGGCGYVKKPDILLDDGRNGNVFNPTEKLRAKTTLKVKVYLGEGWHSDFHRTHFDKCSPPDFYTRVGIAGVPEDSVMKKTIPIEDDWTPLWNQEFKFPLTVPELALLRVEVMEQDVTKKNDFGGQTCLPVSELRSGIRCIPLYNKRGEKYKSVKLLMRFEFV